MAYIPICIQDGDRGGSEEPIAIAKHPGREHPVRTQAYYKYVEESDSVASCKDVATTKVYT
jgi:hypothetical protein